MSELDIFYSPENYKGFKDVRVKGGIEKRRKVNGKYVTDSVFSTDPKIYLGYLEK